MTNFNRIYFVLNIQIILTIQWDYFNLNECKFSFGVLKGIEFSVIQFFSKKFSNDANYLVAKKMLTLFNHHPLLWTYATLQSLESKRPYTYRSAQIIIPNFVYWAVSTSILYIAFSLQRAHPMAADNLHIVCAVFNLLYNVLVVCLYEMVFL